MLNGACTTHPVPRGAPIFKKDRETAPVRNAAKDARCEQCVSCERFVVSAGVDVGASGSLGLGSTQDLAGDRRDFPDAEVQESKQVCHGVAFGPLEVMCGPTPVGLRMSSSRDARVLAPRRR